ncbi:methyltransferase-like protein 27 [Halichondria panicea]|uniref:methyltransferase-like protein 27 n=1 Tax=Halichondria panicea TaxID=6063 RepID=UPI00312B5066
MAVKSILKDTTERERARHFLALTLKHGGSTSYNEWARHYEADILDSLGYKAHTSVTIKWQSYHKYLVTRNETTKHKILDAGCGTGLVGESVVSACSPDSIQLYGGDVSEKMLEEAKMKGIYTDLLVIDLNIELPYNADSFDSIVCAGVFGKGQCDVDCLPNILRVLKPGCYYVGTVNADRYDVSLWTRTIQECDCVLIEDSEMPVRDCATGIVLVIMKN